MSFAAFIVVGDNGACHLAFGPWVAITDLYDDTLDQMEQFMHFSIQNVLVQCTYMCWDYGTHQGSPKYKSCKILISSQEKWQKINKNVFIQWIIVSRIVFF